MILEALSWLKIHSKMRPIQWGSIPVEILCAYLWSTCRANATKISSNLKKSSEARENFYFVAKTASGKVLNILDLGNTETERQKRNFDFFGFVKKNKREIRIIVRKILDFAQQTVANNSWKSFDYFWILGTKHD